MHISSAVLGPLATNCYLIETENHTLLVDPPEDSAALRTFVGERAVDKIVLTHGHFDHVGGTWAIPAEERLIHALDVPYVEHFYPGQPPFERTIDEGDEIVPGLRVMHLPGHSPGSIALIGEELLLVGDVLFAGSIGRTDLEGGSYPVMESSLRRILALTGTYRIFPGHGDPTTLEQERLLNPFLRGLR